jgi:transposase, IS5 family
MNYPSESLLLSLALAKRLHAQQPKVKQKLSSWQLPEVECIGKGKARKPYEFGVKATITTPLKEGLVIGMRTLPGNSYDGHSLRGALEQTEILTGVRPKAAYVDRCKLKGQLGDAMFALLCGCGQNLRLILNHLRITAPKLYRALVQRLFLEGKPAKSDRFASVVAA